MKIITIAAVAFWIGVLAHYGSTISPNTVCFEDYSCKTFADVSEYRYWLGQTSITLTNPR